MQKFFSSVGLLSVTLLALTSCSHKLTGTWAVEKYETTTPGKQGVVLSNIGTMTFQKEGSGMNDISYTVLGAKKNDNSSFSWSTFEDFVTINGENSDFSKTWIQLTNKKKAQRWVATDGRNEVQILDLKKQK